MQDWGTTYVLPFTEKQAASYLTRSVSSLRRDRKRNRGPHFVRIGKSIRYLRAELDNFILSCQRNTQESEVGRG